MTSTNGLFAADDRVRHVRLGTGEVITDRGTTVVVQFREGIESCPRSELQRLLTPLQAISDPEWHSPLEVITRCQAEAIRSVNDTWGVFSRSRIALLPHQLWVCKRVLESWPARWLVADDVGLGKTIEAGLILWPLISRGTVKRILIVCPASLVEQWQYRLKEMFDIRTTRYSPDADTPRSDFWNTHHQVVVSMQTLRKDAGGRHQRLRGSDPWDLLIVDEAHHLNSDEQTGPTLGYKIIEQLISERQVNSAVFFTGTPHRGKDFGFLSLMHLLRPDAFDPRKPARPQLSHLRDSMIRNNKQNATDMQGKRLFSAPLVTPETYRYSDEEEQFYLMLTEFITSGKAYASGLSQSDQRMVMLILIAMQKIASSSVAAIRRALRRRLERVAIASSSQNSRSDGLLKAEARRNAEEYESFEAQGEEDLSNQETEALIASPMFLMEDEEARLRELLAAAEKVTEETKVTRIMEILDAQFADRPVLLFTEYKATQSLLMSEMHKRFGDGCVAFINGDNAAEDVLDSTGVPRSVREMRSSAAERFNEGKVRFLISTEAGGEGIDLQERCHSLVHVDLPWNPMRLHQRVGRLNRYGQKHRVEVIHLRNPDTVEARIWDKLNTKIASVMAAFNQVMDEPEDLLQLVLGMTSPSLFRELYSEAGAVAPDRLSEWFDEKTAKFGGRDAVDAVQDLVGYAAKFDFQESSSLIPRTDLPALAPFLRTMVALNGRLVRNDGDGLSFKTPEAWLDDIGVRSSYEGLIFDRQDRSRDAAERIVGVGHKVLDRALREATGSAACIATLPVQALNEPLAFFTITDDVTTAGALVRSVLVGVEIGQSGDDAPVMIRDWEVLGRLNELAEASGFRRAKSSIPSSDFDTVEQATIQAQELVTRNLPSLKLSFKVPAVTLLAVLWPDNSQVSPS